MFRKPICDSRNLCLRPQPFDFQALGRFALQQFASFPMRRRLAEVLRSTIMPRARPDETRPPNPKSDSDVTMESSSKEDPNEPPGGSPKEIRRDDSSSSISSTDSEDRPIPEKKTSSPREEDPCAMSRPISSWKIDQFSSMFHRRKQILTIGISISRMWSYSDISSTLAIEATLLRIMIFSNEISRIRDPDDQRT